MHASMLMARQQHLIMHWPIAAPARSIIMQHAGSSTHHHHADNRDG
jgi:hypothetical protein